MNEVDDAIHQQFGELVFYVNGKRVHDASPDPEVTLLTYLRTKLRLTGSKLGCGEGGCGACTVMISKWKKSTSKIINYAANACLVQAVSLHGHAVTTVEGIGSTKTKLHAVQERLSNYHGTQCGFCTPGMVMSMYALLRSKPLPQMKDIEETLQGNLCRCTGYRPIIEAFSTFANDDGDGACKMGKKCCRFNTDGNGEIPKDGDEIQQHSFDKYDPTQEVIFPPQLLMESRGGKFDVPLMFVGERCTWFRPITIDHLLQLKSKFPHSKLVSGNTEVGVEYNLKGTSHSHIISVASIDELNSLHVGDEGVTIGVSRPLSDVKEYLEMLIQEYTGHVTQSMKAVVDMLQWFAGTQIRNVAGIGGNLITASPISDLNPIWMTCGAHVEVQQNDQVNIIPVDSRFFTGYRRTRVENNQVVINLHLPFTKNNEYMRAYKISKRKEDDVTIVNAAMRVVFEFGTSRILNYFVAYGGMSATTVMPSNVMSRAQGRDWKDTSLVEDMASWLREDLPLSIDAPGGMTAYRQTLAVSLFLKFYIEIRTELYNGNILKDEVPYMELSAMQPLHNRWDDMKSTQTWQEIDGDQSKIDEVGRSRKHLSADLHVTGEAVYLDDIPLYKDELHLCMVTSTHAHAQIVHVNIEIASRHPGFVAYIDKNDVPGSNECGHAMDDQVFADGKVTRIGQIIGAVVADTRAHAQQAARLVQVSYQDLQPCIITIEDAIKHESYFNNNSLVKHGNAEEEYEKCPVQIEAQLRIGAQEHFYLETNCCIALPKENNEIEIISSSQNPAGIQKETADVIGVARHKVAVTVKRLGGGFGGKETNAALVTNPTAVAAHKLGRPIRCVLDRHEDMIITGTRHSYLGKYKIGATKEGEIVAVIVDLFSNSGNNLDLSIGVMDRSMLNLDGPYKMPNVKICGYLCRTNIASNTAFRGFGGPQAAIITEDIIDRLAGRLNMDPCKVREVNMYRTGDSTYYNMKLNDCQLERCYQQCIKKSEYQTRRKSVDQFNKENLHRKRGLSLNMTKFGVSFGVPFLNQAGALVHIYTDGSVLLTHGGTEMGQGLHTKMIQVAGRVLGIGTEQIYINETSTKTVPNTSPTAASVSSDLNGMAVKIACEKLMKRLKPYRKPEMSWEELISKAYVSRVNLSATGHYNHNETFSWDKQSGEITGSPWSYCSNGCAVSEVEVDCLTGEHVILRTDIVFDVGRSLNPAVDIGQIEGAFMQGYGLYCLEEPLHSPQGSLLTRGPGSYKIPAFGQCPREFNVHLLDESSNPKAIYHSKAIGEPPLLLANSVFFAIKDAIRAQRRHGEFPPDFQLNSPATVERTRMAMADQFAAQHRSELSERNEKKPWSIQA